MDSVFQLPREARLQFLKATARAIGCTYISLWSHPTSPSQQFPTGNYLASIDGWLDDDGGRPPALARLFDDYRKSLCSLDNGCVPGFAYKEGRPHLQLHGSHLTSFAAVPAQRQFYQTAVFMGCKSGEIEVGYAIKLDMRMDINSYFSDKMVQSYRSVVAEMSCRPSSSSSSMPSFSTSSPECSSFLMNVTSVSSGMSDVFLPEVQQAIHPTTPTPSLKVQSFGIQNGQSYSRLREAQFSWETTSVDNTMTQAILAVLSSSSQSSSPTAGQSRAHKESSSANKGRAFRPYSPGGFAANRRRGAGSQTMIKMLHAILRNIDVRKAEEMPQELARTTSNQLHHMISERKRREKLNESFQTLRALLPPGTKKDKASVLATAKDYLTYLKSQISDLEARNRVLETQVSLVKDEEHQPDQLLLGEKVLVQVTRGSESTHEMQQVVVKVTVGGEFDIVDVALSILLCIKEMGNITIQSMEANGHLSSTKQALLGLQIKGSEWDEETFEEAIKASIKGSRSLS